MDWFADPQIWISFFTLTLLEIVLGIDNVIFISILAGKLPEAEQAKAKMMAKALMEPRTGENMDLILLIMRLSIDDPSF